MKKYLAVFLFVLMLATSAFADTIDLTAMTTEELVMLHEQLDAILADRFVCSLDTIYQGRYVVGKDIKAGQYLFSCTKVGLANFWILTTYESEEAYKNYESLTNINLQIGKQAQINLTDGMVIIIGDGQGIIQSIEKPSWTP